MKVTKLCEKCGLGFFLIFTVMSSSFAVTSSYSVVKVDQKNLTYRDLGRKTGSRAHRFGYLDKFYSKDEFLPSSERGESFVLAWKARGVSAIGEKIQIQFEYRVAKDAALKRKVLDVFVDRDGFYETAIDHKGDEFLQEGVVDSWKITLSQNSQVLAIKSSELWGE